MKTDTNEKRTGHTRRLVVAALLMALAFVATKFLAFPLPTGYANLGDCFAFLAGFLLGGPWGMAAAGIGIALADVISPYAIYAPATLIIKAFIALCGAFAAKYGTGKVRFVVFAVAAVLGEAMMVLGYFFFESVFLGVGEAALASVPGNLTQALFGAVSATLLAVAFSTNKKLSALIKKI